MVDMVVNNCDHVVNNNSLIELLKKEKFDVGIVEPVAFCGFGMYLGRIFMK